MTAPTTLYVVTASITRTITDDDGAVWTGTRELPTFYLDPRVQGILDVEAARRVAERILSGLPGELTVHVERIDYGSADGEV